MWLKGGRWRGWCEWLKDWGNDGLQGMWLFKWAGHIILCYVSSRKYCENGDELVGERQVKKMSGKNICQGKRNVEGGGGLG